MRDFCMIFNFTVAIITAFTGQLNLTLINIASMILLLDYKGE